MTDSVVSRLSSETDADSRHSLDLESQKSRHPDEPYWKLALVPSLVTPTLLTHPWPGSGTQEDPFLVEFMVNDPKNPKNFKTWQKWTFTLIMAVTTLAVALTSSAYTGGIVQIMEDFECTELVATLGVSLFVLGFAIGPMVFAPLSELYGRQITFVGSFAMFTIFNAAATGSKNITSLIVFRLLAGIMGSSTMTNAGGTVSDLFDSHERGVASTVFASAPSMGPVFGPIIGGFVGETVGWRWIEGIVAIFAFVMWIAGSFVPETYAPVLLQRRAKALSKKTGKVYISVLDKGSNRTPSQLFMTAISRPWQLLLWEPICLLMSLYIAIVYGTLYLTFGAFPIVFEIHKGWSQGIAGLSFLGVMVGMIAGILYYLYDNKRYLRAAAASPGGFAPPEARIPPNIVGSVFLPISLIWFAWTNGNNVHWIVPIIAMVPFGFGLILVFLSTINLLIDIYTIYAASVLAANSILRSLLGFAFPLFTEQMYDQLGIHWATMIPALLTLICVPFPFLLLKYGAQIRSKCKYAAQAAKIMDMVRKAELEKTQGTVSGTSSVQNVSDQPEKMEKQHELVVSDVKDFSETGEASESATKKAD